MSGLLSSGWGGCQEEGIKVQVVYVQLTNLLKGCLLYMLLFSIFSEVVLQELHAEITGKKDIT